MLRLLSMLSLAALAIGCAEADGAPVVDVYVWGPSAAQAPDVLAEAEAILGLPVVEQPFRAPGVIEICLDARGAEISDNPCGRGLLRDGPDGAASIDQDDVCIRRAWATDAQSTAHEVGHLLGLEHLGSAETPDDSGNLMSQPAPGWGLDAEQVAHMERVAGLVADYCR